MGKKLKTTVLFSGFHRWGPQCRHHEHKNPDQGDPEEKKKYPISGKLSLGFGCKGVGSSWLRAWVFFSRPRYAARCSLPV